MTRAHVLAIAVAVAWSVGPASAQVPVSPALPSPPLPPSPPPTVLAPEDAAAARERRVAEQDRLTAARDRVAAQRDRMAATRDRLQALQDLHIPDIDIHVPDFAIPDLEQHLSDLRFHVPDLDVAIDVDALHATLDALRSMDVAAVARDATARAATALAQGPASLTSPVVVTPFRQHDLRSPEGLYDQARGFIDRDQYERALESLDRLIALNGARADAAMYWKAYSLSKLARHTEALATISDMRTQFANSSWMRDAGFLELETRQASGQTVSADAQVSDDMKLLALQGIMRSDPDTAIPVVEQTLAGNSSVRVKERALFVLSQSRAPRARDAVIGVARTGSNPDLRVAAVRYMGRISGPEVLQALEDIYKGTTDVDVKRAAIQALSTARATDRLGSIARSERDRDLRRAAVRQLGSSNSPEAAESLRAIYLAEPDADMKRTILDALSSNRTGAAALVTLARAEKDPALRTEIVRRLSNSRAPEAREYMLELLK